MLKKYFIVIAKLRQHQFIQIKCLTENKELNCMKNKGYF